MLNQLNRKPKKGEKCLPSDRRRDSFRSEMQRQARVEGEIGDGLRQWWQQIGEIGSLAAWDWIARLLQRRLRSPDRIARSEQQTETLSQIARVCLCSEYSQLEVSNREKWVRENMEAVGLFRDRREMCEENKRKKKKMKALQQDQPKKNGSYGCVN